MGVDHAAVSDDPIVCTDFFKPSAALPVRDRSRANVLVHGRRRRQVSIRGPAPRGISLTDYGTIIGDVIEAAQSTGTKEH